MSEDKKLGKIKSSVFSRGLSLARMTINTSASLASHGVSHLFSSEEKKSETWKELLKDQSRILSKELGQLKGSLMKAGQMLSMYGEHFLPPEANEMLKSLQAESASLEWKVIEKQLKKHLSQEKLDELEVDQEPIGSASLGQVHRAKIKATGELIALKIQYPGVEKAIDSDLRAMKSLFNIMKFLPRGRLTDHIFAEVRDMLVQETDYELEARETEKYRERLKNDSRFIVPQIFPRYSSKKVIATSYEKGLKPDEHLVRNLSQERRNHLSLAFMELYFKELFHWGIVQTDPHLGNYRVRLSPDGKDQLILLDFGAVRTYPQEFLQPYYRMVSASYYNDVEGLKKAAMDLKFVEPSDSEELRRLFQEFCLMTVEPFLEPNDPRNFEKRVDADGAYYWGESDLPQRLTKKVFQMIQKFELRVPPREILFLDRKTGGVFIFLKVLRAKINGHDLLLHYMPKHKAH